ncbi:uncharacterized protein LOC144444355 [Glandiceps talaboti]
MPKMWSNGLFGCFGDIGLCLITYLLPCLTAGRNARAVGKPCPIHALAFFVPILHMFCAAKVRRLIRDERDIMGTPCGDMIVHCFCPCCALVQEGQELREYPAPMAASMGRG